MSVVGETRSFIVYVVNHAKNFDVKKGHPVGVYMHFRGLT